MPAFDKAVEAETRVKGQPLFWKEVLDVEFWIAFFSRYLYHACV